MQKIGEKEQKQAGKCLDHKEREMPVKADSREEHQAGTAQTKVQLWHLSQSNRETQSK